MAQRFGGKFSSDSARPPAAAPGSAPPQGGFRGKRPTRVGFRSNLLFLMPFLFAIRAFRGDPGDLILGLGVFALLMAAAWLTREGLVAEEAYESRRIARRPAFPRKIFASVLTGAGLGLGVVMAGQGVVIAGLLGLIGAALHLGAFGADPLKDKGAEGVDQFQTDRVARAVDGAEQHLAAMRDAILRARDRALEARVERFITTARGLFRTVEGDPRDLTAARRYLGVYLEGARDATVKFADLYADGRNPAQRAAYEALLDDLETTFARRTTDLLSNNNSDLNVEIEVLRERLEFENR
ncbi:5-bromo-4-chloroindolyl phosphate hydrolysis family protein [Szabonella alba]|uniref:5-bromo-4-chloroindolyl phosphate hydrolysis family protein n=1 Tax=Szabonella alba TaxID=2804194 RepID=A0A8K0V7X4_9RHOB|nr:5-bromo-4-chloroindolyl phosphate hydrolysis family protein [Szabonella alba]MBL4915891.1 5-bromo-4-chloroindolyl phosphate hydrolysis family protein [Szabonella alba]